MTADVPYPERDPAVVRREMRSGVAALNILDGGLEFREQPKRAAIDAAKRDGLLDEVPDVALSIVRHCLGSLPDSRTVFEAALASEEHEHREFHEGGHSSEIIVEATINRLIMLVCNAVNSKEARTRLREGIRHELLLYSPPPPDDSSKLT